MSDEIVIIVNRCQCGGDFVVTSARIEDGVGIVESTCCECTANNIVIVKPEGESL